MVFVGYFVLLTRSSECGEDAVGFVCAKLTGALVLCCLACFSTSGSYRSRLGWMKIIEVVFSRKTALLLIYIWTWSTVLDTTLLPHLYVTNVLKTKR